MIVTDATMFIVMISFLIISIVITMISVALYEMKCPKCKHKSAHHVWGVRHRECWCACEW